MFSVIILFENQFGEIIFQKQNHTESLNILENNFEFTPQIFTLQFDIILEKSNKIYPRTNLKQIKTKQNIVNNQSYAIENFKNLTQLIFPIILTQHEIKTCIKGNKNKT